MSIPDPSPRVSRRLVIASGMLSLIPLAALIAYFAAHAVNLPWGEGYFAAMNIVLKTYDGTITPGGFFIQFLEHRSLVSYLLFGLNTLLTRWNIIAQSVISILEAFSIFAMCVLMLRAADPRAALLAAIPFSMLMFEINFELVWFHQVNDVFLPGLFTVIALWVISSQPRGWRALVIAALIASLSAFSRLNGFATWAALPLGFFLLGYRRLKYYGVWGLLLLLCAAFFFYGYSVPKATHITTPAFDVALYLITLLGTAISTDAVLAAGIAIPGMALLAANVIAVRRQPQSLPKAAVWITLSAYALLDLLMVSLGRSSGGITTALNGRNYFVTSALWWMALVAPGALIVTGAIRHNTWLRYANIAVWVIALPLYVATNWATAARPDWGGISGPTPADEQCAWRYALNGDTACMHYEYWFMPGSGRVLYRLAERRLTTYATDNPSLHAWMPAGYEAGDQVIVDAPLAAQHVPLLDQHGAPIPAADVHRLILPAQRALYTAAGVPISEASDTGYRALPAAATRIWLVRAFTHTPLGDGLADQLAADHTGVRPARDAATLYPDVTLFVPGSPPEARMTPAGADFGGRIRLLADQVWDTLWQPITTAAPGQLILVSLKWDISQKVEANYSLFVHLQDGGGRLIGQFDGQYETSLWQPGQPLIVTAALTVPEGAQGPFTLYAGFYDLNDGKRLAATWAGQPIRDDAALLAELR